MKPRSMAKIAPGMLVIAKGMQKGFMRLKPCMGWVCRLWTVM